MIRRSFRIGLGLGLLGGVLFALAKMREARLAPSTAGPLPTEPWPPLVRDPAASEPLVPTQDLVPDPIAPAAPAEPPAANPAPAAAANAEPPEAAPAAKAPAKKAAKASKATRKTTKKAAKKKAPVRALWVEPDGGVCPTTHPVKAKLTSKIFHLPGMLNYERTRPDRCYRDPEAAVDDGLRPAKR